MKATDSPKEDAFKPAIVVTGASGFVGRNFISAVTGNFRIFCIARRTQKESGVPLHKDILWAQADISNKASVIQVAQSIQKLGGADFVIHLAGYYDFTMEKKAEYETVNINGTRNILELAKMLHVKRFIFASSLAGCTFSEKYVFLTEQSPMDANFYYAKSKRAGEDMLIEYSQYFPCISVRFAAVFSDWCEYPPLYHFLNTWLSGKWNARIIGGKGESSITYIHIHDLIHLLLRIIERSDTLKNFDVFAASPSGTVSHNDLFKAATYHFFGKEILSIKIPKYISFIGIWVRWLFGNIIQEKPFETPWMIRYIDKKLIVENDYTCQTLSWHTRQRYDVLRRLPYLINKINNHSADWTYLNEVSKIKITHYPNIQSYDIMIELQETIRKKMLDYLNNEIQNNRYSSLKNTGQENLYWLITLIYQLIATTIRSRDEQLLQNHFHYITLNYFNGDYITEELTDFIETLVNMIKISIIKKISTESGRQEIFNFISTIHQLITDEMEEYEEYNKTRRLKDTFVKDKRIPLSDIEDMISLNNQLQEVFISPENNSYYGNLRINNKLK